MKSTFERETPARFAASAFTRTVSPTCSVVKSLDSPIVLTPPCTVVERSVHDRTATTTARPANPAAWLKRRIAFFLLIDQWQRAQRGSPWTTLRPSYASRWTPANAPRNTAPHLWQALLRDVSHSLGLGSESVPQ